MADNGGNTALMGASFKGYSEIATVLIKSGANINSQHGNGGTALMFASMFGRNKLVKILLDFGADRMILDNSGLMAVDHAGIHKNIQAIEMLA